MENVLEKLVNPKEFVVIDGEKYAINTDFKVWAEIERIIFDESEDSLVRLSKILSLAYPVLPHDAVSAIHEVIKFCSFIDEDDEKKGEAKTDKESMPIYSIHQDFGYIWGAFLSEFGIDLTKTKLHWWKFRALLDCLSEKTLFMKIVGYRTTDISQIKDKETRRFYERMRKLYKINNKSTNESVATDLAESISEIF